MCVPPLCVRAATVSGNSSPVSSPSATSRANDLSPPLFGSTSTTKSPASVEMAILACGLAVHHCSTLCRSHVASIFQPVGGAAFSLGGSGPTLKPCAASASAAASLLPSFNVGTELESSSARAPVAVYSTGHLFWPNASPGKACVG